MDMNAIYNKQISEFLRDHKSRFKQINTQGSQGKVGYQGQLNLPGVYANLMIYLTDNFPYEPPLLYVNPRINQDFIDSSGKVIDDCLKMWGFSSSLSNVVNIILGKLEGKPFTQNVTNTNSQNAVNNIVQQMASAPIFTNFGQNTNLNTNQKQDEESTMNDLAKDLSTRSLEELIYIHFNQDEYMFDFTKKQREKIIQLFQEVTELSNTNENLKNQYENSKTIILENKFICEQSENELREITNQKQLLDGRFTVECLMDEMKKNIDENYQKPRQRLVNEFNSKQIDFENFKNKFKELSMKYHYHNIIKEKLNLYKNQNS